MAITSFKGPNLFLSNYAEVRAGDYRTGEHGFQARKAKHKQDHDRIAECATPGQAKRMGRSVTLRDDWEEVKIATMAEVLWEKFGRSPLIERLLETGEQTLIEGNSWGDQFWGATWNDNGDLEGRNVLGRLLMLIRDYRHGPVDQEQREMVAQRLALEVAAEQSLPIWDLDTIR
jgi:ribA/ribD-fused uncharacterized protein